MSHSCPISNTYVDSHLVRVVAAEVLILGLIIFYTDTMLFGYLLLWDFALRAWGMRRLSPLLYIARTLIQTIRWSPKLCDEAPKRFAVYLGLMMITLMLICTLLSFTLVADILLVSLMLCAAMEALFDYCVGCKIYQYLTYFRKSI